MISTTINTTASTNDNSANCVPMTIPNGAGVVHGKLTENYSFLKHQRRI